VVHVVGDEALAQQLLEQVGLLVGALGRAEAGQSGAAVALQHPLQARGGNVQGLVPAGLPEVARGVFGVELQVRALGRPVHADQRLGQAFRAVHVVEAEAALDAEPVAVGRTVPAVHIEDLLVFHMDPGLTADPAVGAERVHRAVLELAAHAAGVDQGRFHERARGTGLDALAAGHAGARPHGLVEVEDHLGLVAPIGHADHVVDLDLPAGPDAEGAVDASVQVDRYRGVADVRRWRVPGGEAALGEVQVVRPPPELGLRVVGHGLVRLVGEQELEDQASGVLGFFRGALHHHARRRRAQAGWRQDPLTLDLHHAGPAVAVGSVVRLRLVAEMGDLGALTMGHLPDGLAGTGLDLLAV
jgi:hypothetical protein